jgi:hypothetical protein
VLQQHFNPERTMGFINFCTAVNTTAPLLTSQQNNESLVRIIRRINETEQQIKKNANATNNFYESTQ